MRTINKILEYNLSDKEKELLLESGIINGCGGSGGFSFDDFVRDNLEHLTMFDKSKKIQLLEDVKEICFEHDIDFRFKMGFYKANYKFAHKLYKLLHKFPLKYRISGAIIIFTLLNKYGKKYYEKLI